MKSRYKNAFLVFGLVVLAVMVSQLDFAEVWRGLQRAGYWFPVILVLWALLYLLNTASWLTIIRSQQGDSRNVKFAWLYKLTVSGFALNYATPGGLMGGEPYRIMELAPRIGTERASSSVILYAMTHIFSHLCFWLLSVVLFVALYSVDLPMAIMLAAVTAGCGLGIWFFLSGYRRGLANRLMALLRHIPLLKSRVGRFVETHKTQLDAIDMQITALHGQRPASFILAVSLELACRILSALEIYFILLVLTPSVSYGSSILILAFTSLLANLLFFMPLQLGGREGGFLLSTTGLGMTANAAIFVALLVRLRELVWTGIGLMLIKVAEGRKNSYK